MPSAQERGSDARGARPATRVGHRRRRPGPARRSPTPTSRGCAASWATGGEPSLAAARGHAGTVPRWQRSRARAARPVLIPRPAPSGPVCPTDPPARGSRQIAMTRAGLPRSADRPVRALRGAARASHRGLERRRSSDRHPRLDRARRARIDRGDRYTSRRRARALAARTERGWGNLPAGGSIGSTAESRRSCYDFADWG